MNKNVWREIAEDMLIAAYVPEAETLSREEALKLALERDSLAAQALQTDCEQELETAVQEARINQILQELGF